MFFSHLHQSLSSVFSLQGSRSNFNLRFSPLSYALQARPSQYPYSTRNNPKSENHGARDY